MSTVANVNTPRLLTRLALCALGVQLLLVLVVAKAVPRGRGTSFLTTSGFVTPEYEHGWFSGLRVAPIPGTDPTVYISVQSLTQMLVIALIFAALAGLLKTNPWQHGALPNSTPPGRDSGPAGTGPTAGTPPLGATQTTSGASPSGVAGSTAADGTALRPPPRSAAGPAGA